MEVCAVPARFAVSQCVHLGPKGESRLNINVYKKLLAEIYDGKRNALITIFKHSSQASRKILITEKSLGNISPTEDILLSDLYTKARIILETGCIYFGPLDEYEMVLIEPFYPEPASYSRGRPYSRALG